MPKAILKSNEAVFLMLVSRPARTERGRAVQAAVLARVSIALDIAEELSK